MDCWKTSEWVESVGWADSLVWFLTGSLCGSEQMCRSMSCISYLGEKVMWRPAQENPELAKHTNMYQRHAHTHTHTHTSTTIGCCVVNHCPLAGLLRYGKLHMGFIQSIYFTGLWSQCCHQVCSLSALSVKCSCDGPCVQLQMCVTLVWIESYRIFTAYAIFVHTLNT